MKTSSPWRSAPRASTSSSPAAPTTSVSRQLRPPPSADSTQTIALHDLRSPARRLHTFEGHTGDVLHVAWAPHAPTVFASAAGDRRVHVWDLARIGAEQAPDDAEDGAPELLFVHGGHTARPTDFGWAPGAGERWTALSASEDNVLMLWQPTARVWAADEVRVDARELEADAMDVEDEEGPKMEDE
jgi:histone-binding protein RBBP4